MYSFQNERKLNKITVIILGLAIGVMTRIIVVKYPAPSIDAASSNVVGNVLKKFDNFPAFSIVQAIVGICFRFEVSFTQD